jgi:hypothetical protein
VKHFALCAVFALALGGTLVAQTWTVRNDDRDSEYTIITKEEFNRLKRRYEAGMAAALVDYFDSLDVLTGGGRAGSGQAPKLNGYFYILLKHKNLSRELEQVFAQSEATPILYYGHSGRGFMGLQFFNELLLGIGPKIDAVNSASYQRKIREYTAIVEGR